MVVGTTPLAGTSATRASRLGTSTAWSLSLNARQKYVQWCLPSLTYSRRVFFVFQSNFTRDNKFNQGFMKLYLMVQVLPAYDSYT